jgi:hypothetical protein
LFLPSYSPELDPIEQFRSVLKSKVKHNRFLEQETLMTRITEAADSLKVSELHPPSIPRGKRRYDTQDAVYVETTGHLQHSMLGALSK